MTKDQYPGHIPLSKYENVIEGSSLMNEDLPREMEESDDSSSSRFVKTVSSTIFSFVPILKWLPHYKFRENIFNDMVGGFTVGIMHVPQGIAYASLAGVRPVIGLYTSLIPPLFYLIFGTSRHVSIGVFAVISLMSGAANVRVTNEYFDSNSFNLTAEEESEAKLDYAINVIGGLGFLVGIIQIAMGLLRLDFLISFLSDQVVNGFMVGASVHVFIAQMDKILGVVLPRTVGIGKLFMSCKEIILATISLRINLYTTALSLIAMTLLYSVKNFVDPLVKKVTPLPLPYDLVLLIIGTILSTCFDFKGNYGIKNIGMIPTGLPSMHTPDLTVIPHVIGDAIGISIVILVVTISMAKMFAKKHRYVVDTRQEFYALGLMASLSSFFPVWPSSTALARTLVYEAAGTKTQLATVFSSILLLCVIFWIGPFLELLPVCLLSCVIIVALKGMFMKLADIPKLWRASRVDAVIFIVTFLATVCLNIIEGLACGACVSLINVMLATKRNGFVEEEQEGQMIEGNERRSKKRTRYIRYDGSLFFMNTEEFTSKLKTIAATENEMTQMDDATDMKEMGLKIRVVADMSRLGFTDYSGGCLLLSMIAVLERDNIDLYYHSVPESTINILEALPDWNKRKQHFSTTLEDLIE